MTEEHTVSQRLQEQCRRKFESWKEAFRILYPENTYHVYDSDSGPFPRVEGRVLIFSVHRKTSPDDFGVQFIFSRGPLSSTVDALLNWGDEVGHIEMMLSRKPVVLLNSPVASQFDGVLGRFEAQIIICLESGYSPERFTEMILEDAGKG